MINRFSYAVYSVLFLLLPTVAIGHEMWVLTPDMVTAWGNKPLPKTYARFTLPTVLTLVFALGINGMLLLLHRNGANELFPLFRARMRAMRPYASVVLRFCLSWVLLSSALAMEPRYGNAIWSNPSLLAPDILISDLPDGWQWLRWMQMLIGIALLAGIYVRAAAAACLLLVCFSLLLTGLAALSYAPVYIAVALYLIIVGGGSFYLPLPVPRSIRKYTQHLTTNESVSRAQFLLRVITGCNFLYLAVYFKILQPNLMLAIIEIHKLPIMGLDPDVFVLIIAAVEVSIGLLVIFGILLRFLSVVLIAAFIFFAISLSDAETLTSHILYYGVAISFLFNGNGQWRRRLATDSASNIVILGNSISAVAAAQHLDRILPNPSNVQVTLLSDRSDVQFKFMLPEVVSGAVQPNTLVNSLRRLLGRSHLLIANVNSINTEENTVSYSMSSGEIGSIAYDQLIIANDPITDYERESTTDWQGIEHLGSVFDALKIKQNLLHCLFRSRFSQDTDAEGPVNIAIFGGGERGSALAMEIHSLIDNLKIDRCIPRRVQTNLVLLEHEADRKNITTPILRLRNNYFKKRNINVVNANSVSTLGSKSLGLTNGKTIAMDVVVNLSTRDLLPDLSEIDSLPNPLRTSFLNLGNLENVWLASYDEQLRNNPQRRISRQLEQSRLAAFNAWAKSQGLKTRKLKKTHKSLYQCYMGRYSIATWRGLALPSALGWLLNRVRHISTIPNMERKLRIVIDWSLDFIFNNDTADFLEHDYQSKPQQVVRKVHAGSPGTGPQNEAANTATSRRRAS